MPKIAAALLPALCTLLVSFSLHAHPVESAASLPTSAEFAGAIRADDLSKLTKLAATPEAANVADKLSATPLHYAAIYGSADAVRILLSAGADPNARNANGATPLIYAAWNLEKTRLLVERGADVNAAQKEGITPLMVAASAHGNIATLRYLLSKGANARTQTKLRDSALLRSSLLGEPDSLRLLLASGADPHLADASGLNPLHDATGFQDSERIHLLLAAGADPNALNTFGGMVKKGPIALVHMSPLMLAACAGDGDSVNALLKAGARVNEVDIRKMNALMLSIATDHANPEIVRQLLAAGADVNAKDQNGESALTWARKYQNPEILRILESAGAQGNPLPPAHHPAAASQTPTVSAAVGRALPLLTTSASQFFNESGCAGCHHQAFQARAFAAASRAGLHPDPALRKAFLDGLSAARPRIAPSLPVLDPPPGDYDPLLSYLVSLGELGEPANDLTDQMLHYVAVRQDPSGGWISFGISRPPIEESSITRTAMAIYALQVYGWPARHAEFAARIEKARQWLQSATPMTTYEWADKLAGLRAGGVPASALAADAATLLKLQRPDGGWAQTPYLDSDAYATGLVLSSLYAGGLASVTDPSYQKGVDFLLRTQFPDGSWYVRSRSPKFQPYFQSGFPFDHDQWISSAATSLAVMALAPANERVPLAAAALR